MGTQRRPGPARREEGAPQSCLGSVLTSELTLPSPALCVIGNVDVKVNDNKYFSFPKYLWDTLCALAGTCD